MGLKIKPRSVLESIKLGEDPAYEMSMVSQLNGDTVKSHTYVITDSDGSVVTSNFGGGSSESAGVLTFGFIGYATGTYTLTFVVTCNEFLPDATTAREFKFVLTITVE